VIDRTNNLDQLRSIRELTKLLAAPA